MLLAIHFLYPEFLFGLFLLAIPVILHLFSLKKYKKVYFSNFNFLESLQQQKKNSSRLKNLLLLLLRLLAIAAIVIAFSTPYTNPAKNHVSPTTKSQVVIYADNSFSMTNTGTQGSLFEETKKHLFDIVSTYPANTGFRLLTNDAPNDFLLTKEQMIQALGQLKISPASKTLSQIYKETSELTGHQPATLFVISDFQKNNCDFQALQRDSTLESVFLILKPENQNNVYISDVSFEQAFHQKNQNDKIRITVTNASGRDFHQIPVTLTLNGKKKSITQIDVQAHGESQTEITYLNTEEGLYQGIVEIADFPVVFDNKFYFSYRTNSNAEILYIWQDRENPYFGKLFADSSSFHFTSLPYTQIANRHLNRYNLIILDGIYQSSSGLESLWEEYLINGGNLFILPSTVNPMIQNRFLKKLGAPLFEAADTNTVIAHIETQSPLFRDVFEQEDPRAILPRLRHFSHLPITGNHTSRLLSDKRNNPLLISQPFGKGILYVSAFSFHSENSDLVYHPLFVPLMANMACRINSALNTSYFLHTDKPVTIYNKQYQDNQTLKIRNKDHSFGFIADIRKDFSGDPVLVNAGNIRNAGIYEVIQEDKTIDILAWNYDRKESQMQFCTEEELRKQLPGAKIKNIRTTRLDHNSELVKEIVLQDNNRYLTFWFILLAVITLLAEQMVWRKKLN